ncbi:ATP-binding protein [Neobacillus muris]|uniref:ATP-binding protein n=1 Tax=Neobacillus muris TaxID=2941334 RepID=UPI00203FD04E|nr:ATP-binding protein [Neobacillus muris]
MPIDIEILFYQVLIVLFPIVVYHLFFIEKKSDRNKPLSKLTFILLSILVLAMAKPIQFSDEYIYDFRIIPFLISFVYGGPISGLIVTAALLAIRFVIGGEGFFVVLVNYSLTCGVLLLFNKKIKLYQEKNKLLFISLIFWANTFIVMLTLFVQNESGQVKFMLLFYTITWVCMLLVMYIIENVNQQLEYREKLQKNERLNVVSQLAASVAHEVRNPLTSVRGFLQLLSDDENLKKNQREYIEIAISELNHAQLIINDYLSLAKPNIEEFSFINISEEVNKTVALMTSYSNIQNILIQTKIQESLFIKGNKSEIKQVLVNIMKNGIEAMNMEGTLTVNAFQKNGFVLIEIGDSGRGMTPIQLKKLGTPFYTTKEKGTGVGLTISYQLVEAMKGTIMVDSEPGKGTVFTILFPSANH